MPDITIHIHSGGSEACVACGNAYSASLFFITDVGQWNRTKDRCTSSLVVKPDYTTVLRDDRRTSALDDERKPHHTKDPERR